MSNLLNDGSYLLNLPAYEGNLPFHHYWAVNRSHLGAIDFVGIRFSEDSNSWSSSKSGTNENEDMVIFGTHVYAAADGEIIAGWRQYPDKILADPEPNSYAQNTHRMNLGGNHLTIRTNDGHYVFYAHLKNNSIPEELCPNGSNTGWLTMDPRAAGNMTGDFPTELLIPANLRKRVFKGQFLGLVGNSGSSGGPHLHLQVGELIENNGVYRRGNMRELKFIGGLYQHIPSDNPYNWNPIEIENLQTLAGDSALAIAPDSPPRTSLSSRSVNRLDSFSIGADRQLRLKIWDGNQWSDWNDLGGILTSSASSVSWSSDRIDCFARGRNLHLWHKYWTRSNGWSEWFDHGGILTSQPAAVSIAPNRLDVFARGLNNELCQISWNGSQWSNWIGLGGQLNSAPSAVSWASDRIDVVVQGRNNSLWHKYWNGSQWSDWTDLGGILTSAPSISSRRVNSLDVFARGTVRNLKIKQWNGSQWSDWTDLGGFLSSGPSSVSWNSQRIDVQARGGNGNLWHKYWSPSGWSEWTDQGRF